MSFFSRNETNWHWMRNAHSIEESTAKNISNSSSNNSNNNNKLAECFIHFSAGTNCKINYISFRCFFLVTFLCTQLPDGISFVSFHCLCCHSPDSFSISFAPSSSSSSLDRLRTRVPFFLFISLLAVYHFHSLSFATCILVTSTPFPLLTTVRLSFSLTHTLFPFIFISRFVRRSIRQNLNQPKLFAGSIVSTRPMANRMNITNILKYIKIQITLRCFSCFKKWCSKYFCTCSFCTSYLHITCSLANQFQKHVSLN